MARRPLGEVFEHLANQDRLSRTAATQLDAFRRLRNLDSHEGVDGGRLCTPTEATVIRLRDIADQLECPLSAISVMERAKTISPAAALRDVLDLFAGGDDVAYYKEAKTWWAFDRTCVSAILENGRRGASATLDLTRSVSDWAPRGARREVRVLQANTTAKQVLEALDVALDDIRGGRRRDLSPTVLVVDGRTVWHLTETLAANARQRLA